MKINRIGVEENHFHVEQHKKDGHQKIFDGHGLSGIALDIDSAFKILEFVAGLPFRTEKMREEHHGGDEAGRENQLDADGQVIEGGISASSL